ncbi:MAG: hypothetical protein ACTSSP_07235 [Candidatus Asgardarchaeia archaeon]
MSYSHNIENLSVVFNEEQDYLDIRAEYLTVHDDMQSCVSGITFLEFLQFNLSENKNFVIEKQLPINLTVQTGELQMSENPIHIEPYVEDSSGNYINMTANSQIHFNNPVHFSSGFTISSSTLSEPYNEGHVSGIEWNTVFPDSPTEAAKKSKKKVKKKRKKKSKGESISRFDILDL